MKIQNSPAGRSRNVGIDRQTFAVGLAGVCSFLTLYVTQPLLPLFQRIFQASQVEVSLTISAATLGVALSAPWVGLLADARGRKRVIVPAICLLGIVTVLLSTAASLPVLILWRFGQGVLTPGIFAVTVAYIIEEWPREKVGAATSVYVSGTVLGGFLGRFLAGLFVDSFGWRMAFVALGLLILTCAAATAAWLPSSKNFKPVSGFKTGVGNIFEHLKNARLLAIYGLGFCILFSLVGTFTYINFHLAAAPYHMGAKGLGSIFFVYLIGAFITPVTGRWIDRFDSRRTLALSLGTAAIGVLLTLFTSLGLILTGLALCCTGLFVSQTMANRAIGRAAEKARAAAVGLYVSFYYTGGVFGSLVPSRLWQWHQWMACALFIAAVLFCGSFFVLLVWRKVEQHGHSVS